MFSSPKMKKKYFSKLLLELTNVESVATNIIQQLKLYK